MKNHAMTRSGRGKTQEEEEEEVAQPCLAGGKRLLDSFLVLKERLECGWWWDWQHRHSERRGRRGCMEKKNGNRGNNWFFFKFLLLISPFIRPWNPPLFLGMKERYFVFNDVKSWRLIQPRRIQTIGSKWPS